MTDAPHSAQFLTDVRDLWWNADQLHHTAERLRLSRVRHAVDVGCGQGHWTRMVAQLLVPQADVLGVDREPEWIARAQAQAPPDGTRLRFQVGSAEALPLPDAAVELVTCQTLLIHVASPQTVLSEMARVCAPGGTLLLAEPNNISGSVAAHASPDTDLEDLVGTFRLEATCEKGKHALGLGYNSLGERLPGLLDDALWADVQVRVNDKARPARPPYSDEAQRLFADEKRQLREGAVLWSRDETLRYWLAGGGAPAAFDALWEGARRLAERRLADVEAGRHAGSEGGSLFYLISATRR